MVNRVIWYFLAALLALPAWAGAIEVAEAVITTNIVDRVPVDALESYSATVGQLYCFTRIVGAEADTSVTHVWYYGDQEMARVTLPVRSSYWRTWSSKNILPEWTGAWRVEILDEDGALIETAAFTLI